MSMNKVTTTVTLPVSKLKELWTCHASNENLWRRHFCNYRVTQTRSGIVHMDMIG